MIKGKKHWIIKTITCISVFLGLFLAGCGTEEKEPIVIGNTAIKGYFAEDNAEEITVEESMDETEKEEIDEDDFMEAETESTEEYFIQEKIENLEEQMKQGIFSNTKESNLTKLSELESVYKNLSPNVEWVDADLNGDGINDLVWVEPQGNENIIVGIFDMNDQGKCVYWDIFDYSVFCFITVSNKLVRYSNYFGIYDYVSYEQYVYDINWEREMTEGICGYYIYDLEEIWWSDEFNHNDMNEIGTYFRHFSNGTEEAIELDDYIALYEKITEKECDYTEGDPDYFWVFG